MQVLAFVTQRLAESLPEPKTLLFVLGSTVVAFHACPYLRGKLFGVCSTLQAGLQVKQTKPVFRRLGFIEDPSEEESDEDEDYVPSGDEGEDSGDTTEEDDDGVQGHQVSTDPTPIVQPCVSPQEPNATHPPPDSKSDLGFQEFGTTRPQPLSYYEGPKFAPDSAFTDIPMDNPTGVLNDLETPTQVVFTQPTDLFWNETKETKGPGNPQAFPPAPPSEPEPPKKRRRRPRTRLR